MSVEIKFQGNMPESNPVKFYTGDPASWPDGVYQSGCLTIVVWFGDYFGIGAMNRPLPQGNRTENFARISDNPEIASITFAGSMNYPDGKPEGGAA